MRKISDGYTVVKTGIVYSNNGYITDETKANEHLILGNVDGANIKLGNAKSTVSYGYFVPRILFNNENRVYVRGYVIVKDEYGNEETIYTNAKYVDYPKSN